MSTENVQDAVIGVENAQWLLWSRNGRKIACLPCRRRKLACDHGFPTCQRCQRSKTTLLCVYDAGSETPRKRRKRAAQSIQEPADRVESPSRLDTLPSVVESRNAGIGIGGGIHGGGVGPVEFLGPTSISNFFRELNGQLLPSTQILDSQAGLLHTTVNSPGSLGITLARSHAMGMAVEVLQCIPDQETCSMLIRRCQSPVDGWIRPTLHRLSNSLHDTFRPHDNKARRANLTQLAHTLAQNASKVIEEGHEDMEQWLTSITGPNLRWECVGVLFCYWATASIRGGEAGTDDLSPGSMGWSQTHERQTYSAHRYMQCIHHCIDLCGRVGPGSTLLVHLLLLAAYLTSIQHGDASLVADRLLGECITVAVSLGMHVTTSPSTTSFLTEVRRRSFAHVFVVDKNGAILTGRPPRLSRRYCAAPLPLDISDEAVMALPGDQVSVQEVTSGLVDPYGWNVEGAVYGATLTRVRNLFSRIRDEILEITLSVGQSLDTGALRHLKERQEAMYAQLPLALQLDGSPVSETLDVPTKFARSLIRLDHLQNMFFINRLLNKAKRSSSAAAASSSSSLSEPSLLPETNGAHSHSQDLIRISFNMLVVVLGLWPHGNYYGYSPSALLTDYDWLVLGYACPAAGILCDELLRPVQQQQQQQQQKQQESSTAPRRSDIAHQLSLLSGFLTRIGPQAANASLWTSVKDVIHRVLDQLLNTTLPVGQQAEAHVDGSGYYLDSLGTVAENGIPEDMHNVFAFNPLDSFSWMDAD